MTKRSLQPPAESANSGPSGDERALPFLENVEKTHENPWLQYYARRALEAIRTRSAKKGPIERATLR